MFDLADKIVNEIRGVGLNAAFVSIEKDNERDLRHYLESKGIDIKPAVWNHPEGIYIGSSKEPKDLVVLSLKF